MATEHRPDFFIVGAPKCGTTSLAAWLAEHPRVYMSPIKEPHYFNTDQAYVLTRSPRRYARLFAGAGPEHGAVGEASVWYLLSEAAVPNILEYSPAARFVVCLRNPVDMAPSLHEQQVFSGNEHVTRFDEAWRLGEERLRGREVSRWCVEPRHLAYGHACALGTQLERLYARVPADRVLPLLLDDVREDPRREYLRVLAFLGVPDDGRASFPTHNAAKARRLPGLRRAMKAAYRVKTALGIPRLGSGLSATIDRLNTRERAREALGPALRAELSEFFSPEVRRLESLLGRDLRHWVA